MRRPPHPHQAALPLVLHKAAAGGEVQFKAATTAEFKVSASEGIIEGYAATWDRDLGGDRFVKGAFADVIAGEFPANRVKVFREHRSAIGLPLELKEDATGVYIVAKIQPGDTRDGDETLNLADRGVYDSFSVAWVPDRGEMKIATEGNQRTRIIGRVASLPHVGVLSDPMNPAAVVTAVKGAAGLEEVLAELSAIKARLPEEPPVVRVKNLWDLANALEHMAALEGIRKYGELEPDEAEMALELIAHLLEITEEIKRLAPQPAPGLSPDFAGLVGRMSEYANQLRN